MKAVNLIPGEQRSGAGGVAGRSGGAALIVLGLLVGLAVLLVLYGSAHHQISSQAGQVAAIDAQTSAAEARTGRLTAYSSFVAMAQQRTHTVEQLVQSRFDWSHSLHELGRVLPNGAALSTLAGTVAAPSPSASSSSGPAGNGTVSQATPTSSTPPGSTPVFTLTGCATSQSEVAQTLQRLRLIDGAREVNLQSSSKSGGGGAGGGCPQNDPTFSAQISFAALPSAPIPNAPGATPASASGHGGATDVPVSSKGSAVSR